MISGTAAQVRDSRDPATPALGTIAGRVEIEINSQREPVRRAKVTLSRTAGSQIWTIATDRDGRYRFEGVAAGTHRLHAEKPGFVPLSSGPDAAGTSPPIEIQAGGSVTINLAMQRAGALEGRFLDDRGDPIARLTVIADRLSDARGDRATVSSYSATTDDLGRFRVHTLPPGRYRVRATPPPPASGAEMFYPGADNANDASILTVASGQTIDRLEFTVPAGLLSPIAAQALAAVERETTNEAPAPGSSAGISGRITRTDTGQPIANATAEIVSTPGAVRSSRNVARTDADGRFEFTRLAGGEYVLTATANGYIAADATLMRPSGGGTRVAVKDGERVERADVVLTAKSAIEGRILDEFGEPATGVVLQVTQQMYAAGVPRFLTGVTGANSTTGPTDDRGWFRVYGLFPGDYYLLALPEPFERSGPAGFAATYFPGTASADAATPVHVVAGMDAHDVRFSLVAAKTVTISGVATDATGTPVPKTQVLLIQTHNGEVRAMVMARTTVAEDGSFSYRDVPEGTYVVQGLAPGLFGSTPLTVPTTAGRPSRPALTLKPLITARGRVVFEGDTAPPRDPASVTIGFQPTDFTSGPVGSNRIASSIASNWTFEIPNLAWHGVLRVAAPGTPLPRWALARVMLQGRDITDTPYDFQSADVNGIEVVMTSRVGSVSGTVTSGGLAAPQVTVVVVGADSASWTYLSRSFRADRTNAQGAFSLGGLLPGRYLAFALPSQTQQLDPASLLALRSVATPVVVSEGANAALTLTLVK